ncbi:hypothetical protein BKA04_001923 [Cryobacterium mesophilum]|uniref:Uncharacterized protein n=1 Tax=Terrimesophilobacter mesophilus TaxID=433647 RepID=A0A4R8VBN9_9MICO|nr:hypothetical protein [Terrimesophilobacter mesophilus]MBB5633700.1 hypothetical protein [Terrimesophilobacter mesophilus]TFB80389.1 hypothetical protein E3N84_10330 [Terrimesophilobacter mesophilus]
MGLFSGLKKMFDTGGIGLSIEAPKEFDWAQGSIPVTVTITGHESEQRTVTSLDFEFEDEGTSPGSIGNRPSSTNARERNGSKVRVLWSRDEPISLEPGEVKVIEVAVPIVAATPDAADSVLNALDVTLTALSGSLSFGAAWYVLSVAAPVEGAKARRTASDRLRGRGEVRVR